MTESKENRVSVKIFESTLDILEKEKSRFKRGERPDYADLIKKAVESPQSTGVLPTGHEPDRLRWMLNAVIEENVARPSDSTQKAVTAITENLEAFFMLATRRRPPAPTTNADVPKSGSKKRA